MVAIEAPLVERPSAPQRRRQILEAAEQCFRAQGFHAASMAQIAATAKMSPGLIYRYFANKESIVAAIVEHDVQLTIIEADALEAEPAEIFPALFKLLRAHILQRTDRVDCALFLEVMAEAARNPAVAKLVSNAKRRISQRLCALVATAAPGRWRPEEIASKVDLMLIFMDSAAFTSVTDAAFDREKTADQLIGYVARIFEQA